MHESDFLGGGGETGLVSVVIPTYNRAYILEPAIESALNQTYENFEVIVIDDGSTDGTAALMQKYAADPRVRYIYQKNAGVSAARNHGFRESRGEFIALLDSDDAWLPWKLEAEVSVLRQFPEIGMVWTDMVCVHEEGHHVSDAYLRTMYGAHKKVKIESIMQKRGALKELWAGAPGDIAERPVYTGDIFSHMILGNLVHTSTVLIRRERLRKIGGFDEDPSMRIAGEDYEFHINCTSHGPVGFIDASSIIYRIGHSDQITAPHSSLSFARTNLATIFKWLDAEGHRVTLSRETIEQHLADSYLWLGYSQLDVGQHSEARKVLMKSFKLDPNVQTVKFLVMSMLPAAFISKARKVKRSLQGTSAAIPVASMLAFSDFADLLEIAMG